MEEMKSGKLKSGRSGKKVTNPKQAIAIGFLQEKRAVRFQRRLPPKVLKKLRLRRLLKRLQRKVQLRSKSVNFMKE